MNWRKIRISLLLTAAMLLSGCALQTVQDMYRVPKRSEDYTHFQSAIDDAMGGLSYCAPIAGENQQTVQTADLDGDGASEYLLFAKGDTDKPLRILVFRQTGEAYQLMQTIESTGTAFEQIEYVDIDDRPGLEIVVGRQVSEQVLRSLSVYSFAGGEAEQLMSANYARFLCCDLDKDSSSELMVLGPGQTDSDRGIAALYSFRSGSMERSAEAELSRPVESIKRIMISKLYGGVPAVYVASAVDESAILTDVFAIKDGRFTNISFSNESGTSVRTMRNYYVYADDLDDDGILELPGLITMKPVLSDYSAERQYLIRWFAMDIDGNEIDKRYSFHNYLGGWYLQLDGDWARRVSVEQEGSVYTFYVWDENGRETDLLLTLYALTGADREDRAVENNRFVLYRTESTVYAAKLDAASAAYGITQDKLINCFHLIHQDWKTGET